MNVSSTDTQTVTLEREFSYPPERLWRALTQPDLIAQWLMKNDFQPRVDHDFQLTADWGSVDCRVTVVEPDSKLVYTWSAFGLESVVTWTLTPTSSGTLLRMEQTGFKADQQQAYAGAKAGWPQFFARLETTLASI